ncbi:IS66 family insertion sequence element accessory protein TnpB [Clostridium sp. LBM24168]
MLNDASGFEKIYIACGYSDLRKGIDGLAGIVQQQFKLDPFKTGILFLFCGRKTDCIKGLLWESDGFLLLYKRLETGKFQWPRNEEEVRSISYQQYNWLMEGLSIEQKKAIKVITPSRVL